MHTPGSGYVLLHHVMGETGGQRGVWAYASNFDSLRCFLFLLFSVGTLIPNVSSTGLYIHYLGKQVFKY